MKHIYDYYENYLPDGYFIYDLTDIDISPKMLGIGIPQELIDNKIVLNKFHIIKIKFYKLKNILDDAKVQKKLIKSKYLDIEKKPYEEQLSILKEQALKCRDKMNKDLSPYSLDWLNFEDLDLLVLVNRNVYCEDYLLDRIYYIFK